LIRLATAPGIDTGPARKASWNYKRENTRHETKLDWRKMEVEHGLAMQGARMRLGIILAAQMESLVRWVRSPQFTERRLNRIPEKVLLANEMRREFLRFYIRAYFDGAEAYRIWKGRYLRERGLTVHDSEVVVTFDDALVGRLARHAERLGTAAIHAIETRIMPALESAWSPDGTRVKSADDLEKELRTIYANAFIEKSDVPKGTNVLDLAEAILLARPPHLKGLPPGKRRMKVRDRAQYERWQRNRIPHTKFIKQTAAEIMEGVYDAPAMKRGLTSRWLGTERARFHSHGVIDQGRTDADVTHYQYSARGENRCPICDARDGIIRRKDDSYWALNTPPMHHGCEHCTLVPIYRDERVKVTAKKELPSGDDVPDGYGTYDPAKVRSARALGIER
jgi:SPP1 gp7 family putative phage head morphogenesis protein